MLQRWGGLEEQYCEVQNLHCREFKALSADYIYKVVVKMGLNTQLHSYKHCIDAQVKLCFSS
jgi:hypothetical protein